MTATASAITPDNIRDEIYRALNYYVTQNTHLANNPGLEILLSTDMYFAFTNSYALTQNFNGVEAPIMKFGKYSVYEIPGASDKTIVITVPSERLLFQTDVDEDFRGLQVIPFYKYSFRNDIGIKANVKFSFDFIKGKESEILWYHK
jgi:hypothetical protein